MKKSLLPALLILILPVLNSCSTKFNVAAPYKNITVVYALLDMGDTAHYIRVEKAFLSQDQSALTIATVADSSFYQNISVNVYGYYHGSIEQKIMNLPRVDLNKEGYQKDTGAFFNAPNYAYKFKEAIDPADSYRVVVINNTTGEKDSSTTIIVDETSDNLTVMPLFNALHAAFNNFDTTDNTYPFSVAVPASVAILQGFLRLHWVDKNVATGTETDRYADWNFANVAVSYGATQHVVMYATEKDMYTFLRTAMGPAPTGVQRYIDSSDLTIYGGSPDLANYLQFYGVPGTGLTGSDIEPIFTNIKGSNVLGLLASRGSRTKTSIGFNSFTINRMITTGVLNNYGCNVVNISDH